MAASQRCARECDGADAAGAGRLPRPSLRRRSSFAPGGGVATCFRRRRTVRLSAISPTAHLVKGTLVGDYEIQSLLEAGGMGEVYRARDLRLGRDVAVKVLPAIVSSDRERLRRFEQEATAAAALNHPNILAVYQMGTHEGAP